MADNAATFDNVPSLNVKGLVASLERPDLPQTATNLAAKEENKPKICPFPGYEDKDAASLPLVVPDDCEYSAGSSQLEKVDKTRQRSKLVARPEALELLRSIEKPVSVVAVCGPARTGKSYLLSRILRRLDAFKLGHTMRPQTYGVWMGTHYLDFGDYAMVLLDTEGIDTVGSENDHDIRILLLATLLSSYLIYNSKSVFTKHDLQAMECFTRLSSAIALNSMKEEVQESDFSHLRYLFSDFLWLLRDVSLKVPENDKGEQMSTREYMLNEVFKSRKQVGEALENFFATVDCRTLQAPADANSLQESFQNAKDPNSRFLQEVQSLVVYIYSKAREKHGFHKGERVDGTALSMLVKSYLEAINDPNAKPCIEASWKSVVQMRYSQEIAKLVDEYEDKMRKKLTNMLPMEVSVSDPQNPEQPSLRQIHGDMLNRILDKLREATRYFMPADPSESKAKSEELRSQLIGEIIQEIELKVGSTTTVKVVGGVACRFFDENEGMSKSHCANVFDKVSQPLREKVKAAESDPSASESLQDVMEKEIEWLQADYFTDAIGPAKEEVFQSKLKELKQYGSGVARFQQKIKQCMESALEKQRLHDEINEAKAATEELHKTLVRELEKMKKEHDEHMKRVRDDLKRQLHDEQEKVKELTGKTDLTPVLTTITQLSQDLARIGEATTMKQQRDVDDNALKQKIDVALKRIEGMQKQAEMQAEAPSTYQPPSHVQFRKIILPDSAKEKIAEKWFGYMPNKDEVRSECKRLRLCTPKAGFLWRSEQAWIKHFGEQLYMEDIAMLKKHYNIEATDIVVHKI